MTTLTNDSPTYDPPLTGLRIIDLSSGPMTAVARLLADLGAHVSAVKLIGVTNHSEVGPHVASVALGTATMSLLREPFS